MNAAWKVGTQPGRNRGGHGRLGRKARLSVNTRQNRVIFVLATFCGLRVSELCGLRMRDMKLSTAKPVLRLPKATAKGKKARQAPLWKLPTALAYLQAWKAEREDQAAAGGDFFVCSQSGGSRGNRLDRRNARQRFLAAMTCHLVLSSLHTNDAAGSITRLVNIGVEPYLVGASVTAVLAQRLVRRVCSKCRAPVAVKDIQDSVADFLEQCSADCDHLYRGTGCDKCRQTGYRGRVGIFELLVPDDEMRNLLMRNPPLSDIRRLARQKGMRTLHQDGLRKVAAAMTTIEEVIRGTAT